MRAARLALVGLLGLGCALLGGEKVDPPPAPGPELGSSPASVVALLEEGDPGARVKLETLRVSRMDGDFWSDIPARELRPDRFQPEPEGFYSVVALRNCKHGWLDFKGRGMGSWFLFRGGSLVAFQHQGFTPRCDTIDHFVPAPTALLREEREVSRYAGQRYPQPRPGVGEHFARGFAYLEVERVEEAQRMHRAGSHGLEVEIRNRKDRELPMSEEERALRKQRAELKKALDAERIEREGSRGPEEDFFRGVTP